MGTVHRWNPRGFCFIKTGDGEDLFCHASALPNGAELPEGTHVEFDKVVPYTRVVLITLHNRTVSISPRCLS